MKLAALSCKHDVLVSLVDLVPDDNMDHSFNLNKFIDSCSGVLNFPVKRLCQNVDSRNNFEI